VRLGDGRWDDQFNLNASIPLGAVERRNVPQLTLGLDTQGQGNAAMRAGVSGSLGSAGQYGYAGSLSRTDGATDVNVGNANLAYSRRGSGADSVSVGASGAVLVVRDAVLLAPHLGDTVGLIEAKGAAGAKLNLGTNVQVDEAGFAVAPFMTPYEYNHVSLDPEGASLDFQLASSSQRIAPTAGAVVKVSFDVDRGRAAVFNLRQGDGTPLPFGTDALQNGKVVGVIGQGSRLLARVGTEQGTLRIAWTDSQDQPRSCEVDYQLPVRVAGSTPAVVSALCQPR
jgi:outer membrane usher protein